MILSGLSTPLLGLVDTAVMGHLPDARFLGAVAVGAMVIQFLFWAFGFLRMGTTGEAAQAAGAGDGDGLRAVLGRALVLAAVLSGLLLIAQGPLLQSALDLVEASAAVSAEASIYMHIRIWAAPAALANYALWGWFLGVQAARAPLILMLTINGANVILDLLLVVGLGMQTAGVALASLISEYLGLALGLVLLQAQLRRRPGRWRRAAVFNRAALQATAALNADIFLRTLGLMFAFAFFTAQGARLGDTVIAANAVLMNFQTFMAYGLDGFAHAAEALTGQAVGAGDRRGFRRAVAAAGLWSLLCALGFAVVYLLAGEAIVGMLTDLPAVRDEAARYLPWVAASPLISVWAFLLDGVFIGATRGAVLRNAMLICVFLIYLPAWYLLRPLENHGLWLALLLFMAGRGLTLAWAYARIARREGFVSTPPAGVVHRTRERR